MTDTPIAEQAEAAAAANLPAQRDESDITEAELAAEIATAEAGRDAVLAEEHARDLAELLAANGYATEDVTDTIFNVSDPEGHYLYTLTISRTPGY